MEFTYPFHSPENVPKCHLVFWKHAFQDEREPFLSVLNVLNSGLCLCDKVQELQTVIVSWRGGFHKKRGFHKNCDLIQKDKLKQAPK